MKDQFAQLGHLVDAADYKDRWEVVNNLSGGGQGRTFRTRRRTGGQEACLKVLKQQDSEDRRRRFFIEANTLANVFHPRVPRLIETNAREDVIPLAKGAPKLYLATEFINGPTLADAVRAGVPAAADAIALTVAVAETLQALHPSYVHRDLKPENIVLRDGQFCDPVLVDFGLSASDEIGPHTAIGEEIGNRFLRLPELAPGSENKRSTVTDITFTAALLFFALTGERPSVLLDSDGRLPHQRPPVRARLDALEGVNVIALLDIFDRAFQPDITKRFATAEELLATIRHLQELPQGPASPADFLRSLWPRVDEITPEDSMILQQQCRRLTSWARDLAYGMKPLPDWIRATAMAGECMEHGSRSSVCHQAGFKVFDEQTRAHRGHVLPHLVAEIKGQEIKLRGLYRDKSELLLRLPREPFSPSPTDADTVEAYLVRCLEHALAAGSFER